MLMRAHTHAYTIAKYFLSCWISNTGMFEDSQLLQAQLSPKPYQSLPVIQPTFEKKIMNIHLYLFTQSHKQTVRQIKQIKRTAESDAHVKEKG